MAVVNKIEVLKEQIGGVLRGERFQASAAGLDLEALRMAVTSELAANLIDVEVIDVRLAATGAKGFYELQWQSPAGGAFKKQWFNVAPPAREDAN